MELIIDHLTKTYGGKQALNNVSFRVGEGIHGLLGPNGAGKTTLMRLLATLLEPTSGQVEIGGISLTDKSQIRRIVGYLPQEFAFYPGMSVLEAMDYLALLSGVKGRAERKRRIDHLLELVNLTEQRRTKVKALSGGMKRRLGVAQAMIHEPKLLIVDEPTAGLDPEERIRFRRLLSKFAEGRIVLLSTHVVEDVESTCEQMTVLHKGSLRYHGRIGDLTAAAAGRVWTAELDRAEWSRDSERFPVLSAVPEGAGMRVRVLSDEQPYPGAQQAVPSIEDAYLYMMRREEAFV
ncbi:ABC transporter ATP-binding protein [Paenibacillus sonchi]|uniref:ABC transporter ATP-binding protein n=2 Tax=Paenibacillus sonchi TaxID=373687 RepID=A0A974SBE2_9BACL|nr:ABC transporter ATP-binding protein [Paenibacillus sonchi]MCE3200235.1 ABC transporter ATP-binding protein [Paenibacillus sonchi]QQZ59229.1 ABC transporter ATP-binding protein [Paenibacillus sonchi]